MRKARSSLEPLLGSRHGEAPTIEADPISRHQPQTVIAYGEKRSAIIANDLQPGQRSRPEFPGHGVGDEVTAREPL